MSQLQAEKILVYYDSNNLSSYPSKGVPTTLVTDIAVNDLTTSVAYTNPTGYSCIHVFYVFTTPVTLSKLTFCALNGTMGWHLYNDGSQTTYGNQAGPDIVATFANTIGTVWELSVANTLSSNGPCSISDYRLYDVNGTIVLPPYVAPIIVPGGVRHRFLRR